MFDDDDGNLLDASAAAVWLVLSTDGRVLVPIADIGNAAGLGIAEAEAALDQLSRAGLASVWTADGSTRATLTPYAAERLRLKIQGPRWVGAKAPDPRVRIAGIGGAERLASVPDPRGTTLEALAAVEAAEIQVEPALRRKRRADATGARFRRTEAEQTGRALPAMARTMAGVQAWPPRRLWGGACPVCRGRPLATLDYCLWCDRWGLDWILRRAFDQAAERKAERKAAREKAARRETRKQRRARAEAERLRSGTGFAGASK